MLYSSICYCHCYCYRRTLRQCCVPQSRKNMETGSSITLCVYPLKIWSKDLQRAKTPQTDRIRLISGSAEDAIAVTAGKRKTLRKKVVKLYLTICDRVDSASPSNRIWAVDNKELIQNITVFLMDEGFPQMIDNIAVAVFVTIWVEFDKYWIWDEQACLTDDWESELTCHHSSLRQSSCQIGWFYIPPGRVQWSHHACLWYGLECTSSESDELSEASQ